MQEIPAQAFLKGCTRAVSVFTARVVTQLELGNSKYARIYQKNRWIMKLMDKSVVIRAPFVKSISKQLYKMKRDLSKFRLQFIA